MSAVPRTITLDAFPLQSKEEMLEAAINFSSGLGAVSVERVSAAWVVAAHHGRMPALSDVGLTFGTRVFSPYLGKIASWLSLAQPHHPTEHYRVGKALADFAPSELSAAARYLLTRERFVDGWPEAEGFLARAGERVSRV